MPWNDATETIVGQSGEVYTAPVGSAAPTSAISAPAAAYTGMGYHSEDGLTVRNTPDVLRLFGWQEFEALRIARQRAPFQIGFVLLQWNDATVIEAFGGGAVSGSGAAYKYTPPTPSDPLAERSIIADIVDGTRHLRFVIPRGIAVETVESKFTRTALGELPITYEALPPSDGSAPWYFFSDDAAAFAAGS
jgi:hypothetical protein